MRSLRIGLRVEGNADEDFLRPLLLRIAAAVVPPDTAVTITLIGRKERGEEAIASQICDAFRQGAVDLVCIHADADARRRYQQTHDKVRSICAIAARDCAFPASLCVPVVPLRETESWALADRDALCQVFGVADLPDGHRDISDSPEQLPDAKAALRALADAVRKRRSRIQPLGSLGAIASLQALDRCPSFREARTAIEAGFRHALAAGPGPRHPSSARR